MAVRFFYVDESHDDLRFCLSAFSIRHSAWKDAFRMVREYRKELKKDHNLLISKEIHATDFVAGRGGVCPAGKFISKWQRSRIYLGLLKVIARLPTVQIFNVCLMKSNHRDVEMVAWERLLNRIERTMLAFEEREIPLRQELSKLAAPGIGDEKAEKLSSRLTYYHARAVIIADKGKEGEITQRLRKMSVFNHIPSRFGSWPDGHQTKNITVERIIEDPIFKDSARSFFIQLADATAFALLKRESKPTPNILKYGIHKMFDEALTGVCFQKACPTDPLGIVRK